ncbi:TldD/PmbA family protein [bacterium]|nr:TldD/PmbA family protein [bacterium]
MKNRLQDLVRKYKSKCDYLEVRIEEIERLEFGLSTREMRDVKTVFDLGGAIRACCRGGWGFASINALDQLERFIPQVIEQARKVGHTRTQLADFDAVEKDVPIIIVTDPRSVPLKDKVELFRAYNDRVLSYHPAIKNSNVHYSENFVRKTLATSEGTLLTRDLLDLSCGISPTARKNGQSQFTSVSRGSSNDYAVVLGLEPEIERACQIAVELIDASPVVGGKYPVVVDTHLGGTFAHEAFGHFSEADDYMDNPSIRETFPLGKKIGSDGLTIYDTGLDIGTRGYTPFDDEGVPGQKTLLLEHGILVGRLHNRESAAKFNEPLTGSARAKDYTFPPVCRMRNTCIANGTASFEELLEGIDQGVYAIQSIGGHGGEMFSFTALYGFMIRKGRLAEMVRDVSLSGNLFTTLMNIDRIGNDFTIQDSSGGCGKGGQFPLPVTSSSPHFRIKEATVGGAL